MIIVANCKHRRPEINNPSHVYCGRPMPSLPAFPASPLANLYRLNIGGDRAQCVQLFKNDLWRAINGKHCLRLNSSAAKTELLRIAQLAQPGKVSTLFCWCAPEPCHCDVIRAALLWLRRT